MVSRGKPEKGKRLRSQDGRMHRVTQILFCRKSGKKSCTCLVHGRGWVDFSGRSCKKMPLQKFKHMRSKAPGPGRKD